MDIDMKSVFISNNSLVVTKLHINVGYSKELENLTKIIE